MKYSFEPRPFSEFLSTFFCQAIGWVLVMVLLEYQLPGPTAYALVIISLLAVHMITFMAVYLRAVKKFNRAVRWRS